VGRERAVREGVGVPLVAGEGPEDRGLGTAATATAKSSPPETDRAHARGTGERRERTEAKPQGKVFGHALISG
jgi:hypothetical protein